MSIISSNTFIATEETVSFGSLKEINSLGRIFSNARLIFSGKVSVITYKLDKAEDDTLKLASAMWSK